MSNIGTFLKRANLNYSPPLNFNPRGKAVNANVHTYILNIKGQIPTAAAPGQLKGNK